MMKADKPSFPQLERSTAWEDAVGVVKEMIVTGQLSAGDKLPSERDLADMLNVSRPTVREAIRALIALRILESRQGDGTFVTSLDVSLLSEPIDFLLRLDSAHVADLFEARKSLESSLARLATERIKPDDLAELQRLIDSYEASIDDVDKCVDIDIEIHHLIARASGNSVLQALLMSVDALGRHSRRVTGQSRQAREVSTNDHRSLVEVIGAGDAKAAEREMSRHLEHMESFYDEGASLSANS